MAVHVALISPARVEIPSVLVDQIPKGHEHQPRQGHVEKNVDVRFLLICVDVLAEEAQTLEVSSSS